MAPTNAPTIDPNNVPTVTFNLFADNILEHYNGKMVELRDVLTHGCEEFIEGLPTTQNPAVNPVAKLVLTADDGLEGGMQMPGTAILILKSDFYGYMFMGNGCWRKCEDCEAFSVQGAQEAHFCSAYGNFQMKSFGLGTIMSAFSTLNADKPGEWKNCFR